MEGLQTILITLLTLGVLVSFHEFGHFWVARRCGVRVLCFSIGFGPAIWQRTGKDGTVYQIAAIPLGGYVKMYGDGEEEISEADKELAFNHKSVKQRFAIVAAGPIANFLLAIAAYYFIFLSGSTEIAAIVGKVEAGSSAAVAQLQPGEEIVAVDGEPSVSWQQVNMALLQRIGESGSISLSVKYPETELVFEKHLGIDRWLADEEQPNLLKSLGISPFTPEIKPVVGKVMPNSAAAKAGLEAGDELLAIDSVTIADWMQWVEQVRASPGKPLALLLRRGEAEVLVTLTPQLKRDKDGTEYGLAGVQVEAPEWPESMQRTLVYGPVDGLLAAVNKTWQLSVFTLESIKKMLLGLISPKNLSGPITIAKVAASSAKYGLESYLSFLALLSISLGVLNLLPIPVLDGGHLAFYLIEAVKGSPLSQTVQAAAFQIGTVLVLSLMMFALYNDFTRW